MKIFKKNQIIIYVIAVILMTVGYLNYTNKTEELNSVETSLQMENDDSSLVAGIGDAKLVSSNDVTSESNTTNTATSETNTTSEETATNETNTTNESLQEENTEAQTETETQETSNNQTGTQDDYFEKSKLERDTMYSQMIETYENILNSTNAEETQKQSATDEIKKINDTKNSIMICENLIKTKGFEKSIIFVNDASISIIIGATDISQEEVAQIQNIISREMGAEIENIHISTK